MVSLSKAQPNRTSRLRLGDLLSQLIQRSVHLESNCDFALRLWLKSLQNKATGITRAVSPDASGEASKPLIISSGDLTEEDRGIYEGVDERDWNDWRGAIISENIPYAVEI